MVGHGRVGGWGVGRGLLGLGGVGRVLGRWVVERLRFILRFRLAFGLECADAKGCNGEVY